MIWNWLLGLITNENLFSLSFDLLKDVKEDINQDYELTNHLNSDLLPYDCHHRNCSTNSQCNRLPSNLSSNHRLNQYSNLNENSSSNSSINLSSNRSSNLPSNPPINSSFKLKLNTHLIAQSNFNCSPCYFNQIKSKEQKLNKLNSNSLPDLIPEEERRSLVLKEVGIKLRHISESFERSLKK